MQNLLVFLILTLSLTNLYAQESFNYDESKVGNYTLPSFFDDASNTKLKEKWESYKRKEILTLFEKNIYGRIPGKPDDLHFKVLKTDENALSGKSISKQIRIYFTKEESQPYLDMILYLPKNTKSSPVFVGFNFKGNQSIHTDNSIIPSEKHPELLKNTKKPFTQLKRGEQAERWEADTLIKYGYGLATAYYGDLELDYPEGWKTGIRTSLQNILKIKPNEWGAISAWAWGLSRVMDYLETDKQVDAKKIIVHGHSRLGKAALWAGANDKRFAAVISNNSGESGAALSRRWFGETINRINGNFPHWFIDKYKTFNKNVQALPVDQHMLLGLIAPRPLYIASATEDLWADPRGEFLSAKNAEVIYSLYGKKGLSVKEMPSADSPVGKTIRYHLRAGKHNILLYDWLQYIKFANETLK